MCGKCGCGDRKRVSLPLHESLLAGNDREAEHLREHFRERGVVAINLMGSPGAGKTAVLEATARAAKGLKLAAIAGDLETDRDAQRLLKAGIPSTAITTGNACHLDAEMVHAALADPRLRETDVLFIENVGNLVCPAVYDLGQAANVVALSVTEGEDKPLKYPVMFRKADLVLITKIDLLPHLPEIKLETIRESLARTMPRPASIAVSARTGEGMADWVKWLVALRKSRSEVSVGSR